MNINKLAFIADLFYLFEIDQSLDLIDNNHFEKFKDYLKSKIKSIFKPKKETFNILFRIH